MDIQTVDAQALYTKTIVDFYRERIDPTNFLMSFFPSIETSGLEVSIEVQRGFEKIAVDVRRGTDGNLNEFNVSTEKLFKPPYWREYFNSTNLQLYDRLYGATSIDDAVFSEFINDVAEKYQTLRNKILRSQELLCSQVLQTGVITIASDLNIDFKRKAASLVDPGAGTYFDSANSDPFVLFENGANFLRKVGKSRGGTINAILGDDAMRALLNNTKFNARQNLFHLQLDSVTGPQRQAVGSVLHGYITAGSYTFYLWTYPEFYDDASGTSTPYVDPKKVILLPQQPRFKFAYGAVPQLIAPNSPPVRGAFILSDYIDQKLKSHEYHIESAGMPVPTAIDQIYTFKAVS